MIGIRKTTFNIQMRTKLLNQINRQITQITGRKSVTFRFPMSKISNFQEPILKSSYKKSGKPIIYYQSDAYEEIYFYSHLIK